jgi:hypothetical protein
MSRPLVTLEYVRVSITETQGLPISAATVELAFIPSSTGAEPIETDWRGAAWEGAAGPTRVARLLIGPTATVLTGSFMVWYRFTDSPERPARQAGRITFG